MRTIHNNNNKYVVIPRLCASSENVRCKWTKNKRNISLVSDVLDASLVVKRATTKQINYYQHLIVGVNIAQRIRGFYILSLLLLLCACVCTSRQSSCRERVINKFAR